jgi:hypothetical protein
MPHGASRPLERELRRSRRPPAVSARAVVERGLRDLLETNPDAEGATLRLAVERTTLVSEGGGSRPR